MKKRGKLFHFIEMGKNNHEILKDNEVFNVKAGPRKVLTKH